MNPTANGHQQNHQPQRQRSSRQQTAMPCTSPWTEPYQFGFAADHQPQADDQDCQQPTHDALSYIYNRA